MVNNFLWSISGLAHNRVLRRFCINLAIMFTHYKMVCHKKKPMKKISLLLNISLGLMYILIIGLFKQEIIFEIQFSFVFFILNKDMIEKLKNFNKKNPLYFIILFITCSLILSFYATPKTTQNLVIYLISIFCMFVYLSYKVLYYCRNLEISFYSFISYFVALVQLFSLFLIYYVVYPSDPIFVTNLSYFTVVRYFVISIICIFFLILILYKKKSFSNPINPLAEIQKIAYSWNNSSFLGKFSLYNIKNLIISKKYRIFYVFFDVFFNIIPKLITLIITIKFAFFSGDLRELLLLAPYIFVVICISHIQYYLEYIIEGNTNVIQELVHVTKIPNNQSLFFSLTTEAKNLGYKNEDHLPILSQKWLELSSLNTFFNYKKKLKLFSLILSITQIFCWIIISIYFIYNLDFDAIFAGLSWQKMVSMAKSPWTKSKQYFSTTRSLLAPPPRDSGYLPEPYQNQLKLLTKGEFGIGHPIVGELLPNGFYRVDGYLTHGIPPSPNVLYNIIPYSIDSTVRNQNAQHFVAFTKPIYINPLHISKKIQGSQTILENPLIKSILESFLKSIQK